jgi:hypothetical protein
MLFKKGFIKLFYNSKKSKIFLFIIFILLIHKPKNIRFNNSFDTYFKNYFCQTLLSGHDKECEEKLFNNYNYFYEVNEISGSINLLIDEYFSKTENLLLLIGIIPIIKENSIINYKINNKNIYYILKNIFENKQIKNNIIKFTQDDFNSVEKLINIINYNWEIIPSQNIINIIRHVIIEKYEDSFLQKFDDSLNSNFNYYIKSNLYSFSYEELENLMSKFDILIFIAKI